MQPMTMQEIAQACGGKLIGDGQGIVNHIKIDSRKTRPGDLFIAVQGERFDGHDFIDGAYKKGAVCAVSEKRIDHTPYILVESTFQALKDIAEYYRLKMDVKVIAITGSVGKTTAKEMVYKVVSQKFNVHKTPGNFNNEFGLPQTIFDIEEHHQVAVVELGMSNFGEIHNLSKIARPDVCLIMNIGESHIGNLGSRDGIFKAKCEIFDYIKDDALIVLNGDDDKLITRKDTGAVFFGKGKHNDVSLRQIVNADMSGTEFTADCFGEELMLYIPKPGEYLIYPALAAAAVGKKMGVASAQIQKGVERFVPADMRMDIQKTDKITIINDVYNACKQSMVAGASTLQHAVGRKVAIVGDILELGEFGEDIHYETGREMGALGLDLIICIGDLAQYICAGIKQTSECDAVYYETQETLFEQIDALIEDGDTVFVKASRGMRFENITQRLKAL